MQRELGKRHRPGGRRACGGPALAGLVVAALVALGAPSFAQEAAIWARGGCSTCHGAVGQGGGGGENPEGPNLHQSKLTADAVKETVSCGRAGGMPFNLDGAWTKTPCYGQPLGAVPDGFATGAGLSNEQMTTLVNFLTKNVIGVPLTKKSCAVFFGGDEAAPACGRYQ